MNKELLLKKQELELELAQINKKLGLSITKRSIDMHTVLDIVAKESNITVTQLIKRGRKRELIRPRHCFMYIAKIMCGYTFKEVAAILDGRDHSTVIHGCDRYVHYLDHPRLSPIEAGLYETCINKIYNL
jgi:chromosomal replication initiator protein